MTLRVAALGDSLSCGEGVGLQVPLARTWPSLLCRTMPGAQLLSLAVAGSKVRDVRATQLPAAVRARPQLATVLIGLNDVSRSGFGADGFTDDLHAVVGGLRDAGATVLLGRLHDPCRHLVLPTRLRLRVQERVAAVNQAVDRAATVSPDGAVHVLDLDRVPALRLRRAWAVDRLHPTAAAHGLLAQAAADLLRRNGFNAGHPAAEPLPSRPSRAPEEAWWLARHALPWLATHARSVLVPAIGSALR